MFQKIEKADRVKCSLCLILGHNGNGDVDRWGDTLENFHGNDDGEGDYHGDNSRDGYNSGGGMATAMAKAMEMTTKMAPSPLPSTGHRQLRRHRQCYGRPYRSMTWQSS